MVIADRQQIKTTVEVKEFSSSVMKKKYILIVLLFISSK